MIDARLAIDPRNARWQRRDRWRVSGWQPEPNSGVVQTMSSLYREMFNEEPHVAACHAGLECGIIGSKFLAWR